MHQQSRSSATRLWYRPRARWLLAAGVLVTLLAIGRATAARLAGFQGIGDGEPRSGAAASGGGAAGAAGNSSKRPAAQPRAYAERQIIDSGGFGSVTGRLKRWRADASLEEIAESWKGEIPRNMARIDRGLADPNLNDLERLQLWMSKATFLNYEGDPARAYHVLQDARAWLETRDRAAAFGLYTLIYYQGVTALRRGETDNCIMCRGESSCILPIAPSAVHTNPTGSRLAIQHFTDYLDRFPNDVGVRWLLNLAHMTLGEYPRKVDPRFVIPLDHFFKSEFDIGRFRDIGHQAGVDRFGVAGGGVMEDFDNDGLLDLAVTAFDPARPMAFYHNNGDGTFIERTESAGLTSQLGGKNLVQTDFNNDGRMDFFISRGAWLPYGMPQSLLRNDGDGKFTDITESAGLNEPVDSTASRWADYDNDGWLDVFVLTELQGNRLYRNRGNGTFENVTVPAGLQNDPRLCCKGANWFDYDNDDYPDLFIDFLNSKSRLYHNNRDGTFSDVTAKLGIDGPEVGFSCWAWDYDNDGWLDIFATCFDYSVQDVVNGLIGQPHNRLSNRLWHNAKGQKFENKTKEAGLDLVFATMGSNYGDFDNDGFLDFYLGTGDPDLSTLVPNRMFKNVGGTRFADITASSGTGNLQKGHGVSCADWDRDGDLDLFIVMGGATYGDQYHSVLFQNPGQGNHWLSVKLIGQKTNRAAIGARIKAVTAGSHPTTIYRHVSSGSSWGANPLEQTLGLAGSGGLGLLEIHWPTSGTTQTFHDIAADQAIEVTEFAKDFRKLAWKPITSAK
jgi:hypothetical protein